jgi:putative hemolysin
MGLDLLITATRAGVLNARFARLASLSQERGQEVDRALDLLKRRANLRDSLRLMLALLRFLIAGLIIGLFIPLQQITLPLQNLAGLLVVIALVIWLFEFFVERRIQRDPESWALRLTPLARTIAFLMGPILALPIRLTRSNNEPKQLVTITEDELRSFVDASQREGVLEQDERQMIISIFEFADTHVREIMVPRINIFALDVETPLQSARAELLETGYSRIPVYKDNIDNVLGVLYTKDMLKVWPTNNEITSLKELLRPPYFVPETKKLDELLSEMQVGRIHIAIVVDEHGGVAGLVTLEDVVEEIVGEIQDEYDHGEEKAFQQVAEGEYIFHGRINLDEFNELMGSELSTENADTLGGYIFSRAGRVPKVGEKIEENGLVLTIEQIVGRRIRRVRAQRTTANINATEEAHAE